MDAQSLLEYLARELVDDPDAVLVEAFDEDDGTLVLEVSVAEGEQGRVIGRGGRTIRSLRQLVRAASVRDERRVVIDLIDAADTNDPVDAN